MLIRHKRKNIDSNGSWLTFKVINLRIMNFSFNEFSLCTAIHPSHAWNYWLIELPDKNSSLKTSVNKSRGYFKKNFHSRPLFLYFRLLNTVDCKCSIYFLPMTWFKLRTSGIGSDCSSIWATTTAPADKFLLYLLKAPLAIHWMINEALL